MPSHRVAAVKRLHCKHVFFVTGRQAARSDMGCATGQGRLNSCLVPRISGTKLTNLPGCTQ